MGETGLSPEDRFRLLFDDHHQLVLSFALRRVDSAADAADVLAETFVVAWRRLEDVPAGDEAPWLIGVARLVLKNLQRGNLRQRRLADRLRQQIDERVPTREDVVVPGDLGTALRGLSTADREILLLVGWEDLTPAQAAVALGISGDAARTRLARARSRLRTSMAELSREAPPGHVQAGGAVPTLRGKRR